MTTISRYPLQWPTGWKRTPADKQTFGHFGTTAKRNGQSWSSKSDITVYQSIQRLRDELERFGIPPDDIVISTSVPTRLDGLPRSDARAPADPGAAVYWVDGGQHRCMAIDRYSKVEQNIAALAATIEAMRAIERHGGATILDKAFTGFTALPAPIVAGMKRDWQVVLELQEFILPKVADVDRAFKRLASKYHPDREGGDAAKMSELNAARDEALKEIQS